MGSDLKFGPPSGEIGMTSLPVIEKRPISPKPLQIGVSFQLTTNRKSLMGFQAFTSDFLLVVKRNETPICKGLGDIGHFSITGSDVMPISPLGGAKFQIQPHILTAH